MKFFTHILLLFSISLCGQDAIFVPKEITNELVLKNHVRTMTITENFYNSIKDKTPASSYEYAVVNFDKNGRVTSQVYRHNLQRSEFKYDKNNNVIEIDYFDSLLRPIGVSKYTWDESGRKVKQSWKDYQYPINTYTQDISYTTSGKLAQTVMVDGGGKLREKYIYIYDNRDSLGWVTYVTSSVSSTTRMSDRQVICIVYYDPNGNFQRQMRTEYNTNGKTSRTYDSTAKKLLISDYIYENGELVKIVDSHGNVLFDRDRMTHEHENDEQMGNDPPNFHEAILDVGDGEVSPRRLEYLSNGLLSKEYQATYSHSTLTTHEYTYTYWQ